MNRVGAQKFPYLLRNLKVEKPNSVFSVTQIFVTLILVLFGLAAHLLMPDSLVEEIFFNVKDLTLKKL
ncbi:MAG: hypothetical protein ACRC6A_04090 [Fusobacteriaceae bacterium]